MEKPEKITIIEGPPPTFELVSDAWLFGLTESPYACQIAMCRLRSENAPELVERCYREWRDRLPISLEYRSDDGLTQQAPIIAARWLEVLEGQVLLVWVRLGEDQVEIEVDFDDFDDAFFEDDEGFDPTM